MNDVTFLTIDLTSTLWPIFKCVNKLIPCLQATDSATSRYWWEMTLLQELHRKQMFNLGLSVLMQKVQIPVALLM